MKNERQAGHLLFIDGEPNWLDFVSTTFYVRLPVVEDDHEE